MKSYLENLLEERFLKGYRGRESSKSHLKSALYDWKIENNWSNENTSVLSYNSKGFIFLTFTKREPKYCTLRHIITLEEYRGQGVGKELIKLMYSEMREREYSKVRFFADIPSVGFYEKLGYTWHGKSRTGLSFTYTDINTMELLTPNRRDLNKIV